jgi:hypothetical protein
MRKPVALTSTISTCSSAEAVMFSVGGDCGEITRLSVFVLREPLKSMR